MSNYSSFLFSRPSFVGGLAQILDLGDTLHEYNSLPTPELADYIAIASDWRAVGDDLEAVIGGASERLTELNFVRERRERKAGSVD